MSNRDFDPLDIEAATEADAAQAEAAQRQRDRDVEVFKWLMAHKQGRHFMWRLLGLTGLHRTPHLMGSTSEDTAFRCGEQNIGHQLMADIHGLVPERYFEMVKEQQQYGRSRS